MRLSLFLLVFVLTIVGCQSSGSSASKPSDSAISATATDSSAVSTSYDSTVDTTSLRGSWFLMAVLASDTAAGKIPVLTFDLAANKFSGNTGCNAMNGNFQHSDSSLIFDKNIMVTEMACTGYNEAAFMKNLLRTNRFRFSEGMLILMADGVEISKWTRRPERGRKVQKA